MRTTMILACVAALLATCCATPNPDVVGVNHGVYTQGPAQASGGGYSSADPVYGLSSNIYNDASSGPGGSAGAGGNAFGAN